MGSIPRLLSILAHHGFSGLPPTALIILLKTYLRVLAKFERFVGHVPLKDEPFCDLIAVFLRKKRCTKRPET